jgi:ATP-dependent Zn protease
VKFNVQNPKKRFPRWVLIPIAIGICGILAFLGLWQFLTPTTRHVPVAYSDFLDEVHAGRVEEIRIRDREITFRSREASGRVVVKETIGPVPDQALIASLKPDDSSKALPKIYFEK